MIELNKRIALLATHSHRAGRPERSDPDRHEHIGRFGLQRVAKRWISPLALVSTKTAESQQASEIGADSLRRLGGHAPFEQLGRSGHAAHRSARNLLSILRFAARSMVCAPAPQCGMSVDCPVDQLPMSGINSQQSKINQTNPANARKSGVTTISMPKSGKFDQDTSLPIQKTRQRRSHSKKNAKELL